MKALFTFENKGFLIEDFKVQILIPSDFHYKTKYIPTEGRPGGGGVAGRGDKKSQHTTLSPLHE